MDQHRHNRIQMKRSLKWSCRVMSFWRTPVLPGFGVFEVEVRSWDWTRSMFNRMLSAYTSKKVGTTKGRMCFYSSLQIYWQLGRKANRRSGGGGPGKLAICAKLHGANETCVWCTRSWQQLFRICVLVHGSEGNVKWNFLGITGDYFWGIPV